MVGITLGISGVDQFTTVVGLAIKSFLRYLNLKRCQALL